MDNPLPFTQPTVNETITKENAVKLNSALNGKLEDFTDFEPEDEGIVTINHLIRSKLDSFKVDPAILKYFNQIRRGKLVKFVLGAIISQIPLMLVLLVK